MLDLHTVICDKVGLEGGFAKDRYFYDSVSDTFYYKDPRGDRKIRPLKGVVRESDRSDNRDVVFLNEKTKKVKKVSMSRIRCYIENGLPEGAVHLNDPRWCADTVDLKLRWVSNKELLRRPNLDNLKKVFETHPELYERDGFYEEGVIAYKPRPGFYFVPTTKGSVALNLSTLETVFTYTDEIIKPRISSRGDRTIGLNPRIVGKGSMICSRAIGFLTCKVPERHRHLGQTLREIIEKLEVDHIDGDFTNNDPSNLQYLTAKENLEKKLDQERDPRVYPTDWIDPAGNRVRFRSLLFASKKIGCSYSFVIRMVHGWKRCDTVNGYKLCPNQRNHPLDKYYEFFDNKGIPRESLSSFKGGVSFFNLSTREVKHYRGMSEACSLAGHKLRRIECNMVTDGPLSPVDGYLIYPTRVSQFVWDCGVLDIYTS